MNFDFLNFNKLFSNQKNYGPNKLSNQTSPLLDEFLKKTFISYIKNSSLFEKYTKIYDNESSFSKECKDIYILSEKLYSNALNKIKNPIDIKFKDKNYNQNTFMIFDLNDIYYDDFLYDKLEKRPKNRKKNFLCKLISVVFLKLYILLKGIYSTFNYNLTHKFIESKKKEILTIKNDLEELEDSPIPEEQPVTPEEQPDAPEEQPAAPQEQPAAPQEQPAAPQEQPVAPQEQPAAPKEQPTTPEEQPATPEEQPAVPEQQPAALEEEKLKEKEPAIEEIKQIAGKFEESNLFHIFINGIFGKNYNTQEQFLIDDLPNDIKAFENNLKKSKIFNILCNKDNLLEIIKQNILFRDDNFDLIFKNDDKLLSKIKNIIEELTDKSELNSKEQELNTIIETFNNNYKNICSLVSSDFNLLDTNRTYEQIKNIIKTLFSNYTSSRNKLYEDIISQIFIFEDGYILNLKTKNREKIKEIKSFKKNITINTLIKFTNKSKIIIYDLYIEFFKNLSTIFSLLKENDSIQSIKYIEPIDNNFENIKAKGINKIESPEKQYQEPSTEKQYEENPELEESLTDKLSNELSSSTNKSNENIGGNSKKLRKKNNKKANKKSNKKTNKKSKKFRKN